MAERKSQNKYYPPDWDPEKGPLNRFIRHKSIRSHKGPRPKKLPSLGSSVRFELPFNMWCLGCHKHIAMGVRYNAKKNHIGMYHSTPIYQFRFKCHLCDNWFDIHTDPQNTAYILAAGGRKKMEEYDPKDIGLMELPDDEEKQRLETDAFYKLEHMKKDKERAAELIPSLDKIYKYNDTFQDSFETCRKLKQKFKKEHGLSLVRDKESNKVSDRLCLSIPILPESVEDTSESKKVVWKPRPRITAKERLVKQLSLQKDPFG